MPKMLSDTAAAQYAALIASAGMTAQVRTLSATIAEYADESAQDWSEELSSLGIAIPENADERDKVLASLGSAFGSVASEATGTKRGAKVRYFPETGEVSVTFRTVKVRSK